MTTVTTRTCDVCGMVIPESSVEARSLTVDVSTIYRLPATYVAEGMALDFCSTSCLIYYINHRLVAELQGKVTAVTEQVKEHEQRRTKKQGDTCNPNVPETLFTDEITEK